MAIKSSPNRPAQTPTQNRTENAQGAAPTQATTEAPPSGETAPARSDNFAGTSDAAAPRPAPVAGEQDKSVFGTMVNGARAVGGAVAGAVGGVVEKVTGGVKGVIGGVQFAWKLTSEEGRKEAAENIAHDLKVLQHPEKFPNEAHPETLAAVEKRLLSVIDTANDLGVLDNMVGLIMRFAMKDKPAAERKAMSKQLCTMIDAEYSSRGEAKGSTEWRIPWPELGAQHTETVLSMSVPAAERNLDNPAYIKEMERLTNSKFTANNKVKLMPNALEAFDRRMDLINNATESVYMEAWAIYDDVTGSKVSDALIAAKKRGVDVRVIVDGQVAERPHHDECVAKMREAGVEVIGWMDADTVGLGSHSKNLIVDGENMISGGRNIGDMYYHVAESEDGHWVDLEQEIQGQGVADGMERFHQRWNSQLMEHGQIGDGEKDYYARDYSALPDSRIDDAKTHAQGIQGDTKVSVIDHTPGPNSDANIMMAYLTMIEAAQEEIVLTNAYTMDLPQITDALQRARDRGVSVKILANSTKTCDEPVVTYGAMLALQKFKAMGCEIFLMDDVMLHAKDMVVDGKMSLIGSYNIHPRSFRYECEHAVLTMGEDTVSAHRAEIGRRLGEAEYLRPGDDVVSYKVTDDEQIKEPDSIGGMLAVRWFFDQL